MTNSTHPYVQYVSSLERNLRTSLDVFNHQFPSQKFRTWYGLLFDLFRNAQFPSQTFSLHFYIETGAGISPQDILSKYYPNLDIQTHSIPSMHRENDIELHSAIWSILFYLTILNEHLIITTGDPQDPFIACMYFTGAYHERYVQATLHEEKFTFSSAWKDPEPLNEFIRKFGGLENPSKEPTPKSLFELFDLPSQYPACLRGDWAYQRVEDFSNRIKEELLKMSQHVAQNKGMEPLEKLDLHEDLEETVFKENLIRMADMQKRVFQYSWKSIFKPRLYQLAREVDSQLTEKELAQINVRDLTRSSYLTT